MESDRVKVYVRLLDEGTKVSRLTEALDSGNGLFRILPCPGYDPEDESWEFPPGSIEQHPGSSGEDHFAVRP